MSHTVEGAGPPAVVCDRLLSDGRVVQLRPIEPFDADRLLRFHDALSPETNRLRFLMFHPHRGAEVTRFATVSGDGPSDTK